MSHWPGELQLISAYADFKIRSVRILFSHLALGVSTLVLGWGPPWDGVRVERCVALGSARWFNPVNHWKGNVCAVASNDTVQSRLCTYVF